MNFYEVKVSLHADKLLLVRADDEEEAEEIALEALESGDIDMTDVEVEDYVSDVIPATEDFYELPLDAYYTSRFADGDESATDDDIERYFSPEDEEDESGVMLIIGKCANQREFDNETKFKHSLDRLTREYCERMEKLIEEYGE